MSNLVIVAIPDENDRVWKISSEPVPHLTLLFLGDSDQVQNVDMITQFVEHASGMLNPFYLPVDRRGELGDDPELGPADVLFFKKGRYDFKAIYDFRAQLLQDNNIKTANDSASQHEGPWLPHLTLGYKNRPAKPQDADHDYPIYDVSFNTIAVWVDNYDGPSFLLKNQWDEWDTLAAVPMDIAMSSLAPDMDTADLGADFLEHVGIKGMHWGVRRSREEDMGRAAVRIGDTKEAHKAAKKDAKWLKKNHGVDLMKGQTMAKMDGKVFATANRTMKGDVKALNKRPEFSGRENKKQLKDPTSELAQQHDNEHTKIFAKHMTAALDKHNNVSPSGNWTHKVSVGKDGSWMVGIKKTDKGKAAAKHDAMAVDDMDFVVMSRPIRNDDGHIVDHQQIEMDDALTHSASEIGSAFVLEHFGVPGMRWGVRRGAPTAVAPSGMSKVPHGNKRQTTIKVEGGENHPAHKDAIVVAEAKAKLNKSGLAALSNKELQEVQTRLNLERNVTQLAGPSTSTGKVTAKGKKFVKGFVGLNKQVNDATGTALNTHRLYKQLTT